MTIYYIKDGDLGESFNFDPCYLEADPALDSKVIVAVHANEDAADMAFVKEHEGEDIVSFYKVMATRPEVIAAVLAARGTCKWTPINDEWGTWNTECGTAYCFEGDIPSESGYKFCPAEGCGKPIEEVQP